MNVAQGGVELVAEASSHLPDGGELFRMANLLLHPGLLRQVLLQGGGHPVDSPGQLADLVARFDADPAAEVLADPVSAVDERPDRPGEGTGKEEGRHYGQQQD